MIRVERVARLSIALFVAVAVVSLSAVLLRAPGNHDSNAAPSLGPTRTADRLAGHSPTRIAEADPSGRLGSRVAIPAAIDGIAREPEVEPVALRSEVLVHATWSRSGRVAGHVAVSLQGPGHASLSTSSPRLRILTDASGMAQAVGLAPGTWRAHCDLGGEAEVTVEAGGIGRLELLIPEGPAVAGLVVDPRGVPVSGARVQFSQSTLIELGGEALRCDADGRFTLESIGRARYAMATAPGYSSSPLQEIATKDALGPEMILMLGGIASVIRGRVVDSGGAPVSFAWVTAQGFSQLDQGREGFFLHSAPVGITASVDGEFSFEHLQPGSWTLSAQAGELIPASTEQVLGVGQGATAVLTLQHGGCVAGVVLGPDGSTLSGVRVESATRTSATTKEDGSFRLCGLPAGSIELIADAGERGLARCIMEIRPGSELRWDPQILPAVLLTGRLVDESGLPLESWSVLATWPEHPDRPPRRATTDPRGRFVVACPDASPLSLTVFRDNSDPRPRRIVEGLIPGLETHVLEIDRSLLPTAWVEASIEPGSKATLIAQRIDGDLVEQAMEVAFEQSRAKAGPLTEGLYSVAVRFEGSLPQAVGEVRLERDGIRDLGLVSRLPTGSVEITLAYGKELSLHGLTLTLTPESGHVAWSGTYAGDSLLEAIQVAGIPEGYYRVSGMSVSPMVLGSQRVSVSAGEATRITLDLSTP
jgi:hypothetical protein